MSSHEIPAPVKKPFLTTGVKILIACMITGLGFGLYRMIFGLEAATNLTDQYPWGLWIGVDVASGVALAAGGFTTAFLAHIFHREHYHAIVRPALLTAMLGYTFVGIGLMFDLGRWYNIWHPALPMMWQGNSVLFEVGMCVMIYLTVLYIEFIPVVTERFMGRVNLPGVFSPLNDFINTFLRTLDKITGKVMFIFIIAGVVLSCLHQSSLGTLMVIAPYKMHPLYWSLLSPLFFLLSAIAVGYPMVIFESMIASKSFGRRPEMHILSPLAKITPFVLGAYIALKIGDMIYRGTYVYLLEGSMQSWMFWIEFGILTVVPCIMFSSSHVRNSAGLLFSAATMYIVGILLNRATVFFIAYQPPYAEKVYFPAIGEFAVTMGLIAALMLIYRALVSILPVLPAPEKEA
ncbi:MAG: Ni/Fe-hydrogenase cytochrome b subunit [Thermodesulfobacteriota bacterium]|nr:Ni/Fe-hydrogenase cytochrome b subunit [Thermodesulfobacteriota bacterium]